MMSNEDKLKLLSKPFPDHQISKLPKSTKAQTEALKANRDLGIKCSKCSQWHHKDVVHLDYVGHAALTHRLLETDPLWNWEPLAKDADGLPRFDKSGGLWIKLTVCEVTRLGYGHAENSNFKEIGSREKEIIGDALRNAAMRFGAALDLWHKGDLYGDDDGNFASDKPKDKLPDGYEYQDKPIDWGNKNIIVKKDSGMTKEELSRLAGQANVYKSNLIPDPDKKYPIGPSSKRESRDSLETPIEPKQIEQLKKAREEAKLTQDQVKEMITLTFNKESIKEMQSWEMNLLISMIKKKGKEAPANK